MGREERTPLVTSWLEMCGDKSPSLHCHQKQPPPPKRKRCQNEFPPVSPSIGVPPRHSISSTTLSEDAAEKPSGILPFLLCYRSRRAEHTASVAGGRGCQRHKHLRAGGCGCRRRLFPRAPLAAPFKKGELPKHPPPHSFFLSLAPMGSQTKLFGSLSFPPTVVLCCVCVCGEREREREREREARRRGICLTCPLPKVSFLPFVLVCVWSPIDIGGEEEG